MQSSSCSPKKKLIRKNSKTSPTKPKISRAKSFTSNKDSLELSGKSKAQETKSIQDLQNQLEKLSHNDKLYEIQSITVEQLKKICNFVSDKQSTSKLQLLIEEEKVGEMSTEEISGGQNEIGGLQQMLGQEMVLDVDLEGKIWQQQVGIREIQQPIAQPWWLKQEDYSDRFDMF